MIDFTTFDRPVLFADFQPGEAFGSETFAIDEAAFAQWTALYPRDAACRPLMPPGMTAMIVMRGYMHVIPNRPPGNIHGEQQFDIARLPRIGDTVTTTYACEKKYEKAGRKWLYLTSDTKDESGETLFTGRMTSIWAE
jgi:hypothetical protein